MRNLCFILSLSLFFISKASEPFLLKRKNGFGNANDNVGNGKLAIGLKFYPLGFTGKYMLKDKLALEGLFYFWRYGTRITGLGEFHQKIEALSGSEGSTRFYAGGGAHIGFFNNYYYKKIDRLRGSGPGSVYLGLDGVLGLDFKFSEIPLNLSLDWQPSFSFYGDDYFDFFEGGWGGLSIRYMLN
jgi:hypothetical protein